MFYKTFYLAFLACLAMMTLVDCNFVPVTGSARSPSRPGGAKAAIQQLHSVKLHRAEAQGNIELGKKFKKAEGEAKLSGSKEKQQQFQVGCKLAGMNAAYHTSTAERLSRTAMVPAH